MYEQLKVEQEKLVEVEVISVFILSKEQQDKFVKVFSVWFSCEVWLYVLEDVSLIGGVIICVGDLVIDGLVCGKFVKLVEVLKF